MRSTICWLGLVDYAMLGNLGFAVKADVMGMIFGVAIGQIWKSVVYRGGLHQRCTPETPTAPASYGSAMGEMKIVRTGQSAHSGDSRGMQA